jgi:hypothetical protein
MNARTNEAEDYLGRVTVERVREIREVVRVVYEDDQVPLPFDSNQRPELVLDNVEAVRLMEREEEGR